MWWFSFKECYAGRFPRMGFQSLTEGLLLRIAMFSWLDKCSLPMWVGCPTRRAHGPRHTSQERECLTICRQVAHQDKEFWRNRVGFLRLMHRGHLFIFYSCLWSIMGKLLREPTYFLPLSALQVGWSTSHLFPLNLLSEMVPVPRPVWLGLTGRTLVKNMWPLLRCNFLSFWCHSLSAVLT